MIGIDARLDASPISQRKHVEKGGSLPKIPSINLDTEKKYSICKKNYIIKLTPEKNIVQVYIVTKHVKSVSKVTGEKDI